MRGSEKLFVTLQSNKRANNMATKTQVEKFLKDFKIKTKICGLLFRDDRGKNKETLQQLDLVPAYREIIIKTLKVEDYVDGPVVDTLNKVGEMWVFGKDYKQREIYIKIMLGRLNCQTICISFHIAEHPLQYPFK